jgi:preprotein translocase subunit SecF
MIWGVLIGTYSSIFVAVPALLVFKLSRESFSSSNSGSEGEIKS